MVDMFAIVIEPLWPLVGESFQLGKNGIASLMILWAIMSSTSQVLFGYLRDRFNTSLVLIIAPLLTVAAVGGIGFAPDSYWLFTLMIFGGLGIGAFHPEAAVTASGLVPENRTRSLSLFMCGGTLGLGLGPFFSGHLVHAFGLRGLWYMCLPALMIVVFLTGYFRWTTRSFMRESSDLDNPGKGRRENRSVDLKYIFQGRVGYTALLLVVCAMRVVPSVGMSRALAYVLDARGYEEDWIGTTQSVFLISGGIGMLASAAFLKRGWEKKVMVVCPLLGIPLVLVIAAPGIPYGVMVFFLVPTGLLLTGTTPAMVAYSHQLLPRGKGLASSITMGLCWGVSGALVAILVRLFFQTPEYTIGSFAGFLLLSGFSALLLPNPDTLDKNGKSMVSQFV